MGVLRQGLGRRLQQVRKAVGLTQEKLAAMANLDSKYLGSIERGEKSSTKEKWLSYSIKVAAADGPISDMVVALRLMDQERVTFEKRIAELEAQGLAVAAFSGRAGAGMGR